MSKIHPLKGTHQTPEHRRKISEGAKRAGSGKWMLGRNLSDEHRLNIKLSRIGKKMSPETRMKIGLSQKGKRESVSIGAGHWNWQGGKNSAADKIRKSLEYKTWRESVFNRDAFTCQFCGQVGGKLEADHIKPFAKYPELRFEIDNGRTLCKACHKTTDTYLGKARRKSLMTVI